MKTHQKSFEKPKKKEKLPEGDFQSKLGMLKGKFKGS